MKKLIQFAPVFAVFCLFVIGCESNVPSSLGSKEMQNHIFFSVSEDVRVVFSSGNLQYQASTKSWRFAENQYDFIGEKNRCISDTYEGWIDLFGWGTGKNPTNVGLNNWDYPSFKDWGKNKIGDDKKNTWRTLTNEEWNYLLTGRAGAHKLVGAAQVNGVNGILLFPDKYWVCIDTVTDGLILDGIRFKPGFFGKESNGEGEYYAEFQSYTLEEWTELEAKGVVFLPSAGYRDRQGEFVHNVRYNGYYWSASEQGDLYAWRLGFGSKKHTLINTNRSVGRSVRLVKDL
mgnify:CR=1 FL=1